MQKQKVPVDKRMTIAQIRKRLELQMDLDRIVLEQQAKALPSLEVMNEVTQARARISFCVDLLRESAPQIRVKVNKQK